jgi:hypothetical protein
LIERSQDEAYHFGFLSQMMQSFGQAMFRPPPAHEPTYDFLNLHQHAIQQRGIVGSRQRVQLRQMLAARLLEHFEDVSYSEASEILVWSREGYRQRLHLPLKPPYNIAYHTSFSRI